MWWRAGVMVMLLVVLGAGAFFGIGPVTRVCWEDRVILQLRDQPSFKPQESPVLDVASQTVPIRRAAAVHPTVALGRSIYQVNCVICHGDTGRGDGPVGKKLIIKVADLTAAAVRTQPELELFHTIREGKRVMRSFAGDLEDEEIQSLVLFIRTLK